MRRTWGFQTKLLIGSIGVVVATVVLLTTAFLLQVRQSLDSLGLTSMKSFAESIHATLEMQNNLLLDKVKADLNILEQEISRLGDIELNTGSTLPMEITNQITKQKERVEIPLLELGGGVLNNDYTLVDRVQQAVGGAATLFEVLPGKLLRVSTNVKKTDGSRAVGTYIPEDSPVYQATVVRKELYTGIAYVVNQWYVTAYKPALDSKGRVVAVLFVGRPILTPEFRNMVAATKIGGAGFGFLFNEKGEVLLHPTLEGKSLAGEPYWPQYKAASDGVVRTVQDGVDMVTYIRDFEPWKWSYGFTMTREEMNQGMDRRLYLVGLVVAVAAVALAVLVILLLIRSVTRPLEALSRFTGQVAEGDFSARIDYHSEDVIGKTIRGVEGMVRELKNKLGFSEGILNSMTVPCVIVDKDDRITFVNQQELDLMEKPGKPADYLGQNLGRFFYGDDGRETLTGKCVRENTCVTNHQTQRVGQSGRTHYISVDTGALKDLDGEIIGGFALVTDLTAIREGEEQARTQRDRIVDTARGAEDIAQQLSSASEELSAQVGESSKGADRQMQRAQETATAMEQMTATVLEVAKSATEAADSAGQAKDRARQGATLVERVVAAIRELEAHSEALRESMGQLGRQTQDIGAIMQVIEDIADQTNLLALNAAIEAARAGDAGRGFAVVADEVRKLAEKTMTATKEVGQAIANIQDGARRNMEATDKAARAIEESTDLAGKSGQALEEIVGMVERTADQVRGIAAASEEQSATSEQINRATEEINTISTETAKSMTESSRAIEELNRLATQLKDLIGRMQG